NQDDYTVEVDCNPNMVTFTCKSNKVTFICKKHEEVAAEKDFSEFYYIISSGNPDLGLNFDDDSSSILNLRSFKDNTNAQWKIQRIDNSEVDPAETDNITLWTISSKKTDGTQFLYPNNTEDMCLDAWENKLIDGCKVRLHPPHGGPNQQWTLQQVNDDYTVEKSEEVAAKKVKKDFSEFYYIVSSGNPDLGLNFDDDSSSILNLRSFKDNTNAQWKIQRIDNSEDGLSLTDSSPIKDVILINKKTGKAMKYQKQETGAEITQVDPAETDNITLWTISSKKTDGTQYIYPNNTENMCLDGWDAKLIDGCKVRLYPPHDG
ncbi:7306_t:CDS:2, partial [Racocetra persica]